VRGQEDNLKMSAIDTWEKDAGKVKGHGKRKRPRKKRNRPSVAWVGQVAGVSTRSKKGCFPGSKGVMILSRDFEDGDLWNH